MTAESGSNKSKPVGRAPPVEQDEAHPVALAAREEVSTLEKLSRAVWSVMSEFSKRPNFTGKISDVDLSINEVRQSKLKGYEELAHHCYGRTITGQEIDSNDRVVGRFTFRITQANVGEADCSIVARNSPLATQLVTAQPGDEAEVKVPRGMRYLEVGEVRAFEGPSSLLTPSQPPNFRRMTIRRSGIRQLISVNDLRGFVRAIGTLGSSAPGENETRPILPERSVSKHEIEADIVVRSDNVDPTWLYDWSGIYLGSADTQSLGHQFFTQTSPDQERSLNNPRGVTFVEGIGGSGKTSVALGRLKFFANFATGENREFYNLQIAAEWPAPGLDDACLS
jgi:hypothetical protein